MTELVISSPVIKPIRRAADSSDMDNFNLLRLEIKAKTEEGLYRMSEITEGIWNPRQ
jgi:hypothetical protein